MLGKYGQTILLQAMLACSSFCMVFFVIDTSPFLVKDKDAEKQYKFDLQR